MPTENCDVEKAKHSIPLGIDDELPEDLLAHNEEESETIDPQVS